MFASSQRAFRTSFCLLVIVCFCVTSFLHAGELRIETEVYAGDGSEPLSNTVTLFDSGTVYDFAKKSQQVAVFRLPTESRAGQFILLDQKAKRRTELSTDKIEGLMDKLSKWAMEQEDEMLQFSAKPDFEESYESDTGQLTLDHEKWNYTVATVPAEDDDTLKDYRKFVDWYTRLNVMMHGAPPPGPRLALNAALEKYGVVPVEIRRNIKSEETSLRASHLFSWRLSREDRAQVDQVREQLASFEKVENKDFLASRKGKDVVRGQSK